MWVTAGLFIVLGTKKSRRLNKSTVEWTDTQKYVLLIVSIYVSFVVVSIVVSGRNLQMQIQMQVNNNPESLTIKK